jgi:hypothetical protein
MIATATALLALTSTASARDTRVEQSLQELVSSQAAKDAGIDGSVRFYLAGQPVSVQQRLGEDVTNKKTNAANKSDAEACRWVALSALRALQDGARSRGANAVVDIVSYYKKNEFKSSTNYECYAGTILAGVAEGHLRQGQVSARVAAALAERRRHIAEPRRGNAADRAAIVGRRLSPVSAFRHNHGSSGLSSRGHARLRL